MDHVLHDRLMYVQDNPASTCHPCEHTMQARAQHIKSIIVLLMVCSLQLTRKWTSMLHSSHLTCSGMPNSARMSLRARNLSTYSADQPQAKSTCYVIYCTYIQCCNGVSQSTLDHAVCTEWSMCSGEWSLEEHKYRADVDEGNICRRGILTLHT